MLFEIPIFVEAYRPENTKHRVHRCRPLFSHFPTTEDENLRRASTRLRRRLKEFLDMHGRGLRHDILLRLTRNPNLQTRRFKLFLDLRDRMARVRLLFVIIKAFDRRLVFTPALPDLWFEVDSSDDIEVRATEVLSRFFREQLRAEGEHAVTPEQCGLAGEGWVTTMEVDVNTTQITAQERQRELASLFADDEIDGASELQRTGRCLDWLYPSDLDRAIGRDEEVEELTTLLAAKDRRPLLILGAPSTGKTTILHEVVFQRLAVASRKERTRKQVWLLSPQRLISGMSYVGQWENRLLAILDHAKKQDHILYFDDLLGLYSAGQSANSSLSVADVLRNFVYNRDVRVLGEMTPSAFNALAERDRGLADQFHVISVEETSELVTQQIMFGVMRELEGRHRCSFDLNVLPTITQLTRRYEAEAKFPGKAAKSARQLAFKYRNRPIDADVVRTSFQERTGLHLDVLSAQRTFPVIESRRR